MLPNGFFELGPYMEGPQAGDVSGGFDVNAVSTADVHSPTKEGGEAFPIHDRGPDGVLNSKCSESTNRRVIKDRRQVDPSRGCIQKAKV